MKMAAVIIAVSVAATAQAEDVRVEVYEDIKLVVQEVITRELAETAFPNFLGQHPYPLAFLPRTTHRIYRRQLDDLAQAFRADVSDLIVLLVYLERTSVAHGGSSPRVDTILSTPCSFKKLAREMSCVTRLRDETGVEESLNDLRSRVVEKVNVALGHTTRPLVCDAKAEQVTTTTYATALQRFSACLQGKSLQSDPWCDRALALSGLARRDRAAFTTHATRAALKTLVNTSDDARAEVGPIIEERLAAVATGPEALSALQQVTSALQAAVAGAGDDPARAGRYKKLALEVERFAGAMGSIQDEFRLNAASNQAIASLVLGDDLDTLPRVLRSGFAAPDSTDFRELYWVSSSLLRRSIPAVCGVKAGSGDDNTCSAGLKFVDSLGAYTLQLSGGTDGRVAAREAFRDAAIDFVINTDADSGIDRTLASGWTKFGMPRLELGYAYSPSYINHTGARGPRLNASVAWLGWYGRFSYRQSRYIGWHVSLLDLAAPFSEVAKRPAADFTNDEALLYLFARPQAGIHFGLPWLSRNLVLNASIGYRLAVPTRVSGEPTTGEYKYLTPFDANFPGTQGLEFGVGIRYIP